MTIQPWELDANATAYEFMTAGGMNSPKQIDEFIAQGMTAADFAREAVENWTLHVDVADLEAAISEFLDSRPDRD